MTDGDPIQPEHIDALGQTHQVTDSRQAALRAALRQSEDGAAGSRASKRLRGATGPGALSDGGDGPRGDCVCRCAEEAWESFPRVRP